MTRWDLNLVLLVLQRPPFKPIGDLFLHLTSLAECLTLFLLPLWGGSLTSPISLKLHKVVQRLKDYFLPKVVSSDMGRRFFSSKVCKYQGGFLLPPQQDIVLFFFLTL